MADIHSSMPTQVANVFAGFPKPIRLKLFQLRRLIFETAEKIDGVGPIEEALRWGEPAYLTSTSKSGSTVRLGWKPSAPDRYAMYVHCRTTLVDTYRSLFSDELAFEGNRAITFGIGDRLPTAVLSTCIELALTYNHRNRSMYNKQSTARWLAESSRI